MDLNIFVELVKEYAATPGFALVCAFVFALCAAFFRIPKFKKLEDGYKQITAIVLGIVFGFILIDNTIIGSIVGGLAGFVTTFSVDGAKTLITSALKSTALPAKK